MNTSVCSGYEALVRWMRPPRITDLGDADAGFAHLGFMWHLPGLFRSEEELGKTDVKVCCFTRAAIEHRSAFVIEPDVTIKR